MMMSSVFARMAQAYLDRGYSPIARFRKPEPERDGWPLAWSNYCVTPAPPELIAKWGMVPDAQIAVACGFNNLFAPDVDSSDPEVLAAVLEALPQCHVARFGSKGFALLGRYEGANQECCGFKTVMGKDGKPLVEFKAKGNNLTLPPSIHRETGREYYWFDPHSDGEFEDCPALDELPVITDEDIERLRVALAPWSTPPREPSPRRNGFDPNKIPRSRYEAWYRAGLTNAKAKLSGMTEGRPTMLFKSACSLGAGVHHRFLTRIEFESAYLEACVTNGLAAREGHHAILASIGSGLRFAENDELPDLGDLKPRRLKEKRDKPNGGSYTPQSETQTPEDGSGGHGVTPTTRTPPSRNLRLGLSSGPGEDR